MEEQGRKGIYANFALFYNPTGRMEKPFFRGLADFIGRHEYVIVLILFLLVITVASENSLVRRVSVRSEIRSLRTQIERLEREMSHDREVLQELSSDSMIMEHLARERYNMQRADEDVFIERN